MPYVVRENEGGSGTVYKGGKKVGSSRNVSKYARVLRAIEHGWRPTGRKRGK